jgi:DNA-directed RNA polymerase III subunit RPC6
MIEDNMEGEGNYALEEQILEFLKKNPEGVNNESLLASIDANNQLITEKCDYLMDSNRIFIAEVNGEQILKYRSEKEAAKFMDLAPEDCHIYTLIIDSGANGISTNELKMRCKLNTNHLNKILKKLEKKILIKSLKMLNLKHKKIWIGFDIEPSQNITGGAFCSNQEFDKNLIEVIKEKCLDYVMRSKIVSRKDFMIYISSLKILQTDLNEDDIQKIINLLIFDDKLDIIFPNLAYNRQNKMSILLKRNEPVLNTLKYKLSPNYSPKAVMDNVPCTYCPVFKECQIGNVINPKDCPWMEEFVKLF